MIDRGRGGERAGGMCWGGIWIAVGVIEILKKYPERTRAVK